MKKIIITLSLILLSFFGFAKISAQIMPDNPKDYISASPITTGECGNVIRGLNTKEDVLNSKFYNSAMLAYNYVDELELEANMHIEMEAYSGERYTGDLYISIYMSHDKSIYCTISYFLDTIYEIYIRQDDVEFYENITLNLNDTISADIKSCIYDEPIVNIINIEYHEECTEDNIKFLYQDLYSCLYSIMYKRNEYYNGKIVNFIVEYSNPIPFNDLLSTIKITDETEGTISNYEVIYNEYEPVDGKIDVGSYNFRVIASDTSGNTIYQDCCVLVVDASAPQIEASDITVSYTKKLTEDAIYNYITINDSHTYEFSLICEEYFDNYNVPWQYEYTVIATDEYDNEAIKTGKINVIDDVAPIVCKQDIKITHPYNKITDEDIFNALTIKDTIDGILDINYCKFIDLDNYNENHSTLGEYKYEVIVSDKTGNSTSVIVTIFVVDNDYPVISFDTYTLILASNEKYTREDILNILKLTGQIASTDNIVLTSLYFEDSDPVGEYELLIKLPTGEEIKNTICIAEDSNISYDKPTIPNKNINYSLYIIIGITFTMICCISVLSIVAYKKKH